ncbi:MAG: molybdopterin synthase sulfur carrier subunit [Gammaproteobacteria bacterium]|nr:MAG: molybdopterin synthase sulfur carrier subunit [Gammaproteobacteria bacterium]
MSITVKFFASLREQLNIDEINITAATVSTVEDVWNNVTHHQPLPANLLAAVNLEYVSLNSLVIEGDEVAFFPPVTGG